MYPDAVIHVQRNVARIGKPWFFIEQADERYQDKGIGYHEYLRTFMLHLVSEGKEGSAAPEILWKTRAVLDYLCEEAVTKRVIPSYAYNAPYPRPKATVRSGGSVPVGTHEFAVTLTDLDGQETLVSGSVEATTTSGRQNVVLLLPIWANGTGGYRYVRVYYRANSGDAWRNIALIDRATQTSPAIIIPESRSHTLEVPIGALNVDLQHDPPQTSRVRNGFLKVVEATVNMTESTVMDDAHHGYVRLRLVSRTHHVREPASTINQVSFSASIQP
jgi:hypothetical protein